ncbi:MAG: SAM-dependent methyltransferase [Gammaproteobacteria bacterium]|nr:SAM-dependent methyltransferase [Gammaproteobacteria bacterium]
MIDPEAILPHPSVNAHNNVEQLMTKIRLEISQSGPLSFARFMELALYAPGLGYYSAGRQKFGQEGDFTTAPEMSVLYSRCLAKQCHQVLSHTPGDILELGAGTGSMALEILFELERLNSLPEHYYILEISADLKSRQQALINSKAPHLKHKVIWLDTLPEFKFDGVILANEVMDAFPVHRFKYMRGHLNEFYLNLEAGGQLIGHWREASCALKKYVEDLEIEFEDGYESEANLFIWGWIKSISDVLGQGVILLIDYGFPRAEYYHPDRNQGTLMCHYQHQAHSDPLINIGLQDITAHIDFTAVAEAAFDSGLTIMGFTNQAGFLLSCGMIDDLQQQGPESYLALANQVKILTSPNEMGELFKVIALTKDIDVPLLGFSLRNMCERL